MRSSRLPGKALLEINGKPLLRRLCDRLKQCRRADDLLVATSDRPEDDAIAESCNLWSVPCVRGPEKDVTTRFLMAVRKRHLTALVRVTADNPLTDPGGIDELIAQFQERKPSTASRLVIVHNAHRMGYPYGTGAEMADREVLETCDRECNSEDARDNFILFARQNPERFRCVKVNAPPEKFRPGYFLTVDYPEDLLLHDEIYCHFGGRDDMKLEDVVAFLDSHPGLLNFNSRLHTQFTE